MNRHEYRLNIIFALYKHLLLNKDLNDSFLDYFAEDRNEFLVLIQNDLIENLSSYITDISLLLNNWTFDRLSYVEQAILLEACSEVRTGINDKGVVIDEAIRIAKEYCDEDSYRFINGVLDKL